MSAVVLTSLFTEIYPQATACNFGSPQAGSSKFYLLGLHAVQRGRILLRFRSVIPTYFQWYWRHSLLKSIHRPQHATLEVLKPVAVNFIFWDYTPYNVVEIYWDSAVWYRLIFREENNSFSLKIKAVYSYNNPVNLCHNTWLHVQGNGNYPKNIANCLST
jgi:hypothetical protein